MIRDMYAMGNLVEGFKYDDDNGCLIVTRALYFNNLRIKDGVLQYAIYTHEFHEVYIVDSNRKRHNIKYEDIKTTKSTETFGYEDITDGEVLKNRLNVWFVCYNYLNKLKEITVQELGYWNFLYLIENNETICEPGKIKLLINGKGSKYFYGNASSVAKLAIDHLGIRNAELDTKRYSEFIINIVYTCLDNGVSVFRKEQKEEPIERGNYSGVYTSTGIYSGVDFNTETGEILITITSENLCHASIGENGVLEDEGSIYIIYNGNKRTPLNYKNIKSIKWKRGGNKSYFIKDNDDKVWFVCYDYVNRLKEITISELDTWLWLYTHLSHNKPFFKPGGITLIIDGNCMDVYPESLHHAIFHLGIKKAIVTGEINNDKKDVINMCKKEGCLIFEWRKYADSTGHLNKTK